MFSNDLSVTHDAPRRGVVYPTLAEVLDLCHGRIGVMVELKRPRGDTVRRALALMHDDDVLVCFQRRAHRGGACAAERNPHRAARRARCLDPAGGRRLGGRASGTTRVTRRGLETARRYGLETTVYTVNDEDAHCRARPARGHGRLYGLSGSSTGSPGPSSGRLISFAPSDGIRATT